MSIDLPEPLVSADVDLRDFAFMPLDVLRLRDSGLTAKATGDEFRAAVLLWCASWHQIPAGSLPDDDAELANLCGYSRAMKEWKKVRDGALRGFVLCNDGRLYHPTVAEKARESWEKKCAQRARTEAARKAREEARQRQSQSLLQSAQISVTENVTESKGQGQGQGQGQLYKKEEEHTPRGKRASAVEKPEGVSDSVWSDFLAIRKAKRAPMTATALDGIAREAEKAGMTTAEVLAMCCERGWQGFRAEWVAGTAAGGKPIDVARLVAELEAEEAARATH